MESNTAKRRKLGHPGRVSLSNAILKGSGASAFVEAAEELLKDVKLDYGKTFEGVDDTLHDFKKSIEALEPHEPLPIGDVTSKFEKTTRIPIPFPNPRPAKDSNYKLSFAPPAKINVVGSYQLKTMVKTQTELGVDMIVVMPAALFQEKDYLNFRYFYKRAYYCAYISAGIQASFGSSMDLSFEELHGNDLLPILVARPKELGKSKYCIRIIPCAPEGVFSSAKLLPKHNSVRLTTAAGSKVDAHPTPFYNATLRAESLFSSYLLLVDSTAKSCPSYKDACVLGRIWLRQRGFGGSISEGGFGHFEWAALVALLLQGTGPKGEAKLSSALGSSQIFRGTLQFLAGTNFQSRKKLVVLGSQPFDLDAIRQEGPLLYDSDRELNVLWKMSPWSAKLLTVQARQSLAGLKDTSLDQLDSLFIVKVDQPSQTYDLSVKVDLPSQYEFLDQANHRGLAWDFSDKLFKVLGEALGDRKKAIHIFLPKSSTRPISSVSSKTTPSSLLVGIILDPNSATRKLDFGPPAEEKELAAQFREFWGEEKSELRRFQDGSILECIEWETDSSASIPEQVIRYITKKHLRLVDNELKFYGDNLSKVAHIDPTDIQSFTAAKKALEVMERDIRDLDDLPLHIRRVAGSCPELRYASCRAPLATKHMVPMDIVVSFEASGKWPDNLAAIQRLKIAFLLKIGTSLQESNDAIKTYLGLDHAERDTENLAFLDIVYETGFAFRLRVQSDAEDSDLEKQARDKTRERHVQTETADLLAISKKLYTQLPLHNQIISTWCTRLPPLSASIRLVKHWFSSQKLMSHFDEELLELVTLQAFLKPYPWQTPSSATTGFLRTIQVLSRWEWLEEPMIVDTSDPSTPMSASDRSAIFARFNECRKLDPRLNRTVLFVASPNDPSGTAFTREGPSRVVANQMTKLAGIACELVKTKGLDLDPRYLFQSSLRHYDVVIRLDSKLLRALLRNEGNKHSQFKNLEERPGRTALPLVEHPVRAMLRQLKKSYSAALVFFHGGEDDHVIAGLWNQELVRHSRTSRVNMPCSFKPTKGDEASLKLDKNAMLAEIARIGGDLIEEIEVKDGN